MAKNENLKIGSDELCKMLNCRSEEFPNWLVSKLDNMNTTYREINIDELKEYVLYTLKKINQPNIVRTKKENLYAFEKGWNENLEMLLENDFPHISPHVSLKPKYFRPNKFLRYNKRLIVAKNLHIEYDLFTIVRYLIFTKYLSSFDNIYELGCGSCHNLFLLSELFPSKRLYGFDWTSSSREIAKVLSNTFGKKIEGILFDMTNPSSDIILKPGSAIITIHSLEQIGYQYEKLLRFIIKSKPGIVINYEPIIEFYDENDIFDYIAIIYSQKRNYLHDYYKTLCALEKENKIEIIEAKRPYIGGIIHEASLTIWKPL